MTAEPDSRPKPALLLADHSVTDSYHDWYEVGNNQERTARRDSR